MATISNLNLMSTKFFFLILFMPTWKDKIKSIEVLKGGMDKDSQKIQNSSCKISTWNVIYDTINITLLCVIYERC